MKQEIHGSTSVTSHFIAQAWVKVIATVLYLCRGAVGVFYNLSQLGKLYSWVSTVSVDRYDFFNSVANWTRSCFIQ